MTTSMLGYEKFEVCKGTYKYFSSRDKLASLPIGKSCCSETLLFQLVDVPGPFTVVYFDS